MDASHSDDAEFLEAFDAFAQAVRRARGAPVQTRGTALTLSQYGLLQPLQQQPVARVRDLADQAGVTPSTATRILDALERRDLVRRTRSSADRRAVAVSLTEAGGRQLSEQDEWVRSRERAFFMQLPAEEREFAPDLLRRLASFITDLAAGPEAEAEADVAMVTRA
jgi:DNA-binding MarR family transcriptional regulator